MGQLKESNNVTATGEESIVFTSTWLGQAFLTTSGYTMGSVKLKLFRENDPGTVTVSIRATTLFGSVYIPTGDDLISGTIVGTTISDSAADWVEILLSSPYSLSATTRYAIVLRKSLGSSVLVWQHSGDVYSGGNWCRSTNSGSSWSGLATLDFLFENYDNFNSPSDITTIRRIVAAANNKIWYEDI